MRKYYIVATLILAVFSAFAADPTYITDKSTCSATSLSGLTSGNVSLRTVYQPKSVPITWESNGTTYTTTSCTYDTQLQLPNAPSRLGHTFRGWTLYEEPAATGFNYGSTCSSEVEQTVQSNYAEDGGDTRACLDLNGDGACVGKENWAANAPDFGITEAGQWGVSFVYGKVVGEALCSSTSGEGATTGTPDTSSSGGYCWCRAMGYMIYQEKQGVFAPMCAVSSPAWVFTDDVGLAADCASDCALKCVDNVNGNSLFRAALFGEDIEKPKEK